MSGFRTHALPSLPWEENGDDEDRAARLYASANVCGVGLHFEAIAVDDDGEPLPGAVFSSDALWAIFGAVEADTHWERAEIPGFPHRYVILATPFCS